MRCWLMLLVLAATACSQPTGSQPTGSPVAHVTNSPSPQSSLNVSPSPTYSPPPIERSPVPDLPVSTLGFSCRLPVYSYGSGTTIDDSFIAFPSARVTADAAGKQGMYFDRAFSRWLPVPRAAVAPDGAHYAEVEMGQNGGEFTVHVIDVPTGTDRAFHEQAGATGLNFGPVVLDYSAEGIYLVQAFERLQAGLWLVNPTNGSVREVSSKWTSVAKSSGFVWVEVLNPADPNPVNTASSAGILSNEIDRIDLKTGGSTRWMYRPGRGLSVVGFDLTGQPLILSSGWGVDSKAELFTVPDPAIPRSIFKGELVQSLTAGIADSHGVWLGGSQGIYLFSQAGGLKKVSDHAGIPANGCF